MKLSSLQNFIRSNGYAWPGGYPMALLMADGEAIDAQSARENYRIIRRAVSKDWTAENVFIHWEGDPIICANSGREIPSAYGSDE
jgi:hypothetical protein